MADRTLDDQADLQKAARECVQMNRALMKLAERLGNPALHWSAATSNIYEAIVDHALERIAALEKACGGM